MAKPPLRVRPAPYARLERMWDFGHADEHRAALHESGHAVAASYYRCLDHRVRAPRPVISIGERDLNGFVTGETAIRLSSRLALLAHVVVLAAGRYAERADWTEEEWLKTWTLEESGPSHLDDLFEIHELVKPKEPESILGRAFDVLGALRCFSRDVDRVARRLEEAKGLTYRDVARLLTRRCPPSAPLECDLIALRQ